ncbi:hypothetical protein [Phyllobacterium sp. K27]
MAYVPYRTAALLAPINEIHHLTVIMNDACAVGECLRITVTSIKANKFHDNTCVLNVGDHPFIKHPSYMLYRMAECSQSTRIGKLVDKNYYLTREDFAPEIFELIAAGIYDSDETPLRIVKYAHANGIS